MKKHSETADGLARDIASRGPLSASFSRPRTKGGPERARLRKTGDLWQLERIQGTKAFHRNLDGAALRAFLAEELGSVWGQADFTFSDGTIAVLANRRGELTALERNAVACAPPSGHDREKKYLIPEGTPIPFLVDLGVMTAEGKIVASRRDKFRQINRFLEFIDDVLPELEPIAKIEKREISIIDFGCGKSYLTFAIWWFLAVSKKLPVRIVGLDLKEDVIRECDRLARDYGYEGLSFRVGDIADFVGADFVGADFDGADFDGSGFSDASGADLVISLHACDVATDLALERAIEWKARVILAVPCCQHELNGQLAKTTAPASVSLETAFRHGIVRERIAALLTDAMRADLLETAGYRVQILEFIDMSHTPKNLLIRAVRARAETATRREAEANRRAAYERLRDFLGADPALERALAKAQARPSPRVPEGEV